MAGKGKPGREARPLEERLWEKIQKRGDEECWPWTGTVHPSSKCGQIRSYGHSGPFVMVPRLLYQIVYGEVPRGLCVYLRCGWKLCCNPKHLGTRENNWIKKHRPGRNFTVGEYDAIRKDRRSEIEVAREWGVKPNTVGRIKTGMVGVPPLPPPRPRKEE